MTVSWGSVGPRQMGTLGQCAGAKQPHKRQIWLLPSSASSYLFLQVISGQQLPKVANSKEGAIIDPLVRVEIYGVPADQAHQETKYIENNGETHSSTRDPAVPRHSPCCPSLSAPAPSPQGLTPAGMRRCSFSSTCLSWPSSASWWRIMTRLPGMISSVSSP